MKVVGVFSWPNTSLRGRIGPDGGPLRLYTRLFISIKAFWEDVASDVLRERGVKNRLNFLGVIEGFLLSFFPDFPSCKAAVGGSSWDGGGVVWREESVKDIVLVSRIACGI